MSDGVSDGARRPTHPAAGSTGTTAPTRRPRLGFLGTGWIGRDRLEAIHQSGWGEVAAVADASAEATDAARAIAPDAEVADGLDALLDLDLDGLVIATPSAMHAEQSVRALERGVAVFCQKPLARTAAESQRVVEAARAADRLLGVDLSYRFTRGMRAVRELVAAGELGDVYAVELVFHNAYGPDKAWFRDPGLAGGGCVIDLGIHLVDLALWTLGWPGVEEVASSLYAQGRPLLDPATAVEDHALATLRLSGGATARLACSWHLSAGQDAVIEASFYGTRGGAAFRNVGGSFYDFEALRFQGTRRDVLAEPPDAWGGRAAVDWARRLGEGARFDAEVERIVDVAAALDAIYDAARRAERGA
ncbi:MAG TPA: Gfo/Idh/MocA family oxidoreductase [Gemmatirosa sp.]|nr:Gfo/Idh/MocA family oxidoreductase [Gemmatirosa sp.]